MLIDWFTIAAQLLNFIILIWLLKHFLYKPILKAIDAREQRIATQLADADATKAQAEQLQTTFQQKNETFDQQRAELLNQATVDAQAERQRLIGEARQVADDLTFQRMESLKNDAHNLRQAITLRTQQEVFAIARKALMDLAGVSLEARLGEVFTQRVREMAGETKADLATALKTASGPVLVRSAFSLPTTQQAAIQQALNETFALEIPLRFVTAPEVISGIELIANGQKLAWSIADYLVSLEKSIAELLPQPSAPPADPEPQSTVDRGAEVTT